VQSKPPTGGEPQPPNPYNLDIAADLFDDLHQGSADVQLVLELAREAGGPILELACGTGRCLIPLIRAGFDVVGLDLAPPMLERLQTKVSQEPEEVRHRATTLVADGSSFSLPLRFGLAFMVADAFGQIPAKQQQESLAVNVFDHLRAGGVFVIDTFHPDIHRLLERGRSERTARGYQVVSEDIDHDRANQVFIVRTSYSLDGHTVSQIEWPLRYSFRFELEHLLEKVGFTIEAVWGNHRREPVRDDTRRLFVVARKPSQDEPLPAEAMEAVALVQT